MMADVEGDLRARIAELEEENRRLRGVGEPVAPGLPSRETLDALFAGASVGLSVLRRDGSYLYRSPWTVAFTAIFGVEGATLFEAIDRTSIPADDLSLIRTLWARFLEAGTPSTHTFPFVTPEGEAKWVRANLSALGDFVLLHLTDVTDLKRVHDAMLATAERYRTLVDNLGVGVYTLSDPVKGTFGSVNPALARLFGYDSVAEVMALGSSVMVYENPEDRATLVKGLLDNQFQASSTVTFEVPLLKKDRSSILVRIVAHGTFDADGNIIRVDGAVEDITARRMAEEALRESEYRFRRIFETAAVGIVITSPTGRVVQANPAFCSFLGYTQEELRSMQAIDLTHPDHVAESRARSALLDVPGAGSFQMEKRYLRKDGSAIWGHTSATTLFDEHGRKLSGIAIVQDINERRLMETDLLRMQKLESLAVLAGGIAHDFNNILTGVLGNVSLARAFAKDDEKQTERLARAERAATRARDLTMQLQTFARGGQPDRRTAYIGDVVREAAEFSLRGSRVRCDLRLEPDPWPVEIDPGQMGQVIGNLLINAQQAMPDGGSVEVCTENTRLDAETPLPLPPGDYVCVGVGDRGVGIPEADLGRIFDPYYTTKATGSGLGLATAWSIVRKHDGYIGVESTVGVGTRFSIYLPASKGRVQVIGSPAAEGAQMGTGRILLMDDEDIVVETVPSILREFGYEVEVVRDGAEVLPRYRAAQEAGAPFDLVIMDLTVPGGRGGADVIGELRRHDPHVRALVSSGYSSDPVLAEYERWGFQAALPKPHSADELLRAVRRVLSS
jgi:two-component system cell cycle sensor histidine kinase/response regulator CckA